MRCTVLTVSRSQGIGSGLTYDPGNLSVKPGSFVQVPLRNKIVDGIVLDVLQDHEKEEYDVKSIKEIFGESPLLTESQIKTVRWMADYYCCTVRAALSVWLPSPPWAALLPKVVTLWKLSNTKSIDQIKGKKQIAVLEFLESSDAVTAATIQEETGATLTTLKTLEERGFVSQIKKREEVDQTLPSIKITEPTLTELQQNAYDSIRSQQLPSLLFGITGSGKTEVYAKLIADTIREGKQAILLVPEILLTENCIDRFRRLLNAERIAVVHSKLTPTERREIWKNIHRGAISLVIGSRSALFASLQHLGLVILDEEHEWTYKNEQTPRYHARETAEALCRFSKARLVLGSATPSLESWSRAKAGLYHLARLPERYKNQPLPSVRIIDLADVSFGQLYPFSPPLIKAMEERLERKEQSVLFLNRRGIATALLCLNCRRRVVSPESQLPFTVHERRDGSQILVDHSTGLTAQAPSMCPHCKSPNLRAVGAGTQRIEHIVAKLFPKARILRADSDTLTKPEEMRELLDTMKRGDADILLGTQSVVKGLDLPNVTLAAVVLADVGLSLPHFRAGERVFQLLTQLVGRSGRSKPGEVIIQTFRPEAEEILRASRHEVEPYLEQELRLRLHTGYPPAVSMIRYIVRGNQPKHDAEALAASILLKAKDQNQSHVKVSFGPTLMSGGKEWHVLVRGLRKGFLDIPLEGKQIVTDVDPLDCI
ncbi:primosomal protein N' [Candidatus Peribacteria bacterium RIFCSPHIGHO2_02_FULL_52_16]|nr:MAG: primosomal protein N' [Candidatus Peribacteria bacterium RIFCSPHIGHO2_01_FULL_51_35]OGJ61657.1 MAG: primosomal protein N' [Candidatus Peribacteria bacterium RIFCSPHIGHO2_02_FULL_52_16]